MQRQAELHEAAHQALLGQERTALVFDVLLQVTALQSSREQYTRYQCIGEQYIHVSSSAAPALQGRLGQGGVLKGRARPGSLTAPGLHTTAGVSEATVPAG